MKPQMSPNPPPGNFMQNQMGMLGALQQGNTQPYGPMSFSQMTKGSPDAMMAQLQAMYGGQAAAGAGGQQPGRPDPTPGQKPPPGGGQQPGGGAGDQRFNMFSWQPFENMRGVQEGDLGSLMRYYANMAAQQPKPLNMGKFFGQGSQPGQQRKGFGEV